MPLVVRVPKNFMHLVDHKNGSRADGFVSFIDFGPTILHLAGINAKFMDGSPFLEKEQTESLTSVTNPSAMPIASTRSMIWFAP